MEAWIPPTPEPADEPWTPPVDQVDDGWAAPAAEPDDSWASSAQEPADDPAPRLESEEIAVHESEQIVPHNPEEVRPIVSDAPDDSIVVSEELVDAPAGPMTSGLTPGASSLSAAIRAAAGAAASGPSDDEAQLLSEAANGGTPEDDVVADAQDGSLRRTVKSLVSPSSEASSGGGFGDLSARFRQAAAADQED